ncbi:MAG: hypothetical protein ACR652_19230 [Methylocystis sp.]|uniref:hypothetical protein n=1 Tax=Methylocystis sp. TaxID=1911079 RepID=UPI003DA39772
MSIDAFDPFPASRRIAIRYPASAGLRWESRATVGRASTARLYVEAAFLGCLLTGVASVLPLVMLLHR